MLRGLDNARSLMYYAGWAAQNEPDELALAASAFRLAAGKAFDHAARAQISVHGGIGATWNTMRRCTSAARSSHAGCSAARRGRPIASRASC